MSMLARADNYGVKLIRTIEDLPEINDFASLGVIRPGTIQVVLVHIAQGDDIFGSGDGIQIRSATTT